MGQIGKQSAREILRADGQGPQTIAGRNGLVESIVESNRCGVVRTTAGNITEVTTGK
jgi:hypothetical protein